MGSVEGKRSKKEEGVGRGSQNNYIIMIIEILGGGECDGVEWRACVLVAGCRRGLAAVLVKGREVQQTVALHTEKGWC